MLNSAVKLNVIYLIGKLTFMSSSISLSQDTIKGAYVAVKNVHLPKGICPLPISSPMSATTLTALTVKMINLSRLVNRDGRNASATTKQEHRREGKKEVSISFKTSPKED